MTRRNKARKTTSPATITATKPIPSSENVIAFWNREAAIWKEIGAELRPLAPWFFGLTALAFLFRFFQLTEPDLWMDEIIILKEAYTGEFQTIAGKAHSVHLGPVGFFMHLFGQNAFGLRFWGAFLSALALPLFMTWGAITGGRRFAIATGLLALTNCFLQMYAQDGNYYGGMFFYTVIQLIGYTVFFRGGAVSGLFLTVVATLLSFKNHPMGVIPGGVMLGLMSGCGVLMPSLREKLLCLSPKKWIEKPALPLVILAIIGAIPFTSKAMTLIARHLPSLALPGQTGLLNVEGSFSFFWSHFSGLTTTFFRTGGNATPLALIFLLYTLGGIVFSLLLYKKNKQPEVLGFLLLAITLPIAAYLFLFSIKIQRFFYLRYFTFLIPILIGLVSACIAFSAELFEKPNFTQKIKSMLLFRGLLFPPVLISLGFTSIYFLSDLSNYSSGVQTIPSDKPIIATSSNDPVEGIFHLNNADIKTTSPNYTCVNRLYDLDLYSWSFPAMMMGTETTIMSGWRYTEAPAYYSMLELGLKKDFKGTSRWGAKHDLWIATWDYQEKVVFPYTAASFKTPNKNEPFPVLFTGAGTWEAFPERALFSTELPKREILTNKKETLTFIPKLPNSIYYPPTNMISFPLHNYLSLTNDSELRIERDDTFDFILYQPEETPRTMKLRLFSRDTTDPILKKNSQPIPDGMMVSINVDGIHQGFWDVPDNQDGEIILPLDLELSPGNHRVSITGCQPRLSYTPYFPWKFGGFYWDNECHEEKVSSLEKSGQLMVSPGWNKAPSTDSLDQWLKQSPWKIRVDESIKGPAGDAAIALVLPADVAGYAMLLTPPMPVESNTLALCSYYVKLQGIDSHELLSCYLLIGKDGNPIGSIRPGNGPNLRGTTYGKGWQRREIAIPISSDEISAVCFGVMTSPRKSKWQSSGGTAWVASFSSPGCQDIGFTDPQLPDSWFHITEDSLDDE